MVKKKNLPSALQDSRAYINSEVTPFLSHKHQFSTAKHQVNTDKLSFIFSARITHDQELAFIIFRRLLVKKEFEVFMCWHPGRSHYIWQFLCQVHENWHFSLRALFLVYLVCFSFAGAWNSVVERAGSHAQYIPQNMIFIGQVWLFCPKLLYRWGYEKHVFCQTLSYPPSLLL